MMVPKMPTDYTFQGVELLINDKCSCSDECKCCLVEYIDMNLILSELVNKTNLPKSGILNLVSSIDIESPEMWHGKFSEDEGYYGESFVAGILVGDALKQLQKGLSYMVENPPTSPNDYNTFDFKAIIDEIELPVSNIVKPAAIQSK